MSKRRKFSDEFKREAVGLTLQPGANVSQIARDIGVGAGVLGRWRRELETDKAKAFAGSGVTAQINLFVQEPSMPDQILSWRP